MKRTHQYVVWSKGLDPDNYGQRVEATTPRKAVEVWADDLPFMPELGPHVETWTACVQRIGVGYGLDGRRKPVGKVKTYKVTLTATTIEEIKS
jgi:hypothetical protein